MTHNPPPGGLTTVGPQVGSSSSVRCRRQQAPVVRAVSPASGPLAGGFQVTITGSGFTGANGAPAVTAVNFGPTPRGRGSR